MASPHREGHRRRQCSATDGGFGYGSESFLSGHTSSEFSSDHQFGFSPSRQQGRLHGSWSFSWSIMRFGKAGDHQFLRPRPDLVGSDKGPAAEAASRRDARYRCSGWWKLARAPTRARPASTSNRWLTSSKTGFRCRSPNWLAAIDLDAIVTAARPLAASRGQKHRFTNVGEACAG